MWQEFEVVLRLKIDPDWSDNPADWNWENVLACEAGEEARLVSVQDVSGDPLPPIKVKKKKKIKWTSSGFPDKR